MRSWRMKDGLEISGNKQKPMPIQHFKMVVRKEWA